MNSTNIWAPTVLGADDEKTKISTLNKLIFLPEGKCQANKWLQPIEMDPFTAAGYSRTSGSTCMMVRKVSQSKGLLGPSLERYGKSNRFRIILKQGSRSRQKSITSCKKKHGLERKTELWKWPRTTPRVLTAVYVQQNTAKGLHAGQSQPHSIYSLRSSLEEAE